ncbi:MAG: hypothetical protein IJ379_10715 [Lachnospiraceae bacterium]|nr:hypothetical protein [Lachnospiraceae bacterium]
MCRRYHRYAGYMTVEAALILSTVLMVYLFLIRSFLWIYDRCILEQDMASWAIKATYTNNQMPEEKWREWIRDWDTEKYLWMVPYEPMVQKKGWDLVITGRGEVQSYQTAIQYRLRIIEPVEWLRMKRRAKELVKQKGGKE